MKSEPSSKDTIEVSIGVSQGVREGVTKKAKHTAWDCPHKIAN